MKILKGIGRLVVMTLCGMLIMVLFELLGGGVAIVASGSFESGCAVGHWIGLLVWIAILAVREGRKYEGKGSGRYVMGSGNREYRHERRH